MAKSSPKPRVQTNLSVYMPADDLKAVKRAAKDAGLPVNAWVRDRLACAVLSDNFEQRKREANAALADRLPVASSPLPVKETDNRPAAESAIPPLPNPTPFTGPTGPTVPLESLSRQPETDNCQLPDLDADPLDNEFSVQPTRPTPTSDAPALDEAKQGLKHIKNYLPDTGRHAASAQPSNASDTSGPDASDTSDAPEYTPAELTEELKWMLREICKTQLPVKESGNQPDAASAISPLPSPTPFTGPTGPVVPSEPTNRQPTTDNRKPKP